MGETIDAEALTAVWKQHVDAWKQTEQSQKEFCQAHDLPYHRFVYWRKKFEGVARGPGRARSRAGFAAVVREAPVDTGLTLSLPNGVVVRGICAANVAVVRQLLDQFR
jgi:hypothetical protein